MLSPDQTRLLIGLRTAFEAKRVRLADISAATGVHISQVSRILAGESRRASRNLLKVCEFASAFLQEEPTDTSLDVLKRVLERVWNGTPAHAKALADLLLAVDQCSRTSTGKPSGGSNHDPDHSDHTS